MKRQFSRKLAISAIVAIGAASLLGSCGSGGNGSAAPSPAPTPTLTPTATPTPVPTPTPTATPLAGWGFVEYVGDFAVLGYSATGTTGNGGGTRVTLAPGGITFRRTSVSAGYELKVPNRDFGTLGSAVTFDHVFSSRSGSVPSGPIPFTYKIYSLIPGLENSLLGLEHSGLVSWEAGVVLSESGPSPTIDQNFGSFVYGKPTAASALPSTGRFTYTGKVFDGYFTPGDLTVTIDFATREVSGFVTPRFNDGIGGIGGPGPIPFSGTMPPELAGFTFSFPVQGTQGTLAIQLTGPAGQELIALWSARTIIPHVWLEPADYYLPGAARRP